MSDNIRMEVMKLQSMNLAQLKKKWLQLFEAEPPGMGPTHLRRRLAYTIQANHYGGLDGTVQTRIAKVARPEPTQTNAAGVVVGTKFVREWKGKRHTVTATAQGFELEGCRYASLSGAAKAITGTSWNGKTFFGVK